MRYLIVLSFLIVLRSFFSQENLLESKNQYTFSLVNGLNRNATKVEFGELSPENALSVVHGFNFYYTRILQPKFSMSTGLGFGFLPTNIKVKSFEDFDGTDVFDNGFYANVHFSPFSRLELLGAYHQEINDKIELKYSLGAGLVYFGSRKASYGFGNYFDSTFEAYEVSDIEINYDNRFKPFVSLGIEVTKKLKNKDLLSFKLSYDHSFSNAYTGTYSIFNETSRGQYFNRGSFLNMSVGYVITGDKKLNRIKELQTLNHVDPKKAKKLLRKENRFIDPKSSFLNISGGTGFGGTKVHTDPNGSLENYAYPTFLPRISFEKGIKNNIYWEIGMHSQLFYDVTKFTIARYSSSGSGVFYAVQLSGGGLYRWVLKNNYNVINIHTGLSLGFHGARNDKNGIHSWGSGGMNGTINGNPVVYDYSSVSSVKSNVLTSLYLGLSKDFRIVNNFYFTLNYRQQVGLYKVYESTYNYSGLSVPTTIGARTKITGSSKDFQFGFKIKLK
jgi:hypothetical protein